jgi:hypothetical protein
MQKASLDCGTATAIKRPQGCFAELPWPRRLIESTGVLVAGNTRPTVIVITNRDAGLRPAADGTSTTSANSQSLGNKRPDGFALPGARRHHYATNQVITGRGRLRRLQAKPEGIDDVFRWLSPQWP